MTEKWRKGGLGCCECSRFRSENRGVNELADDVQPLVFVRVCPILALGEVNEPVSNKLNEAHPHAPGDQPDKASVDQGLSCQDYSSCK